MAAVSPDAAPVDVVVVTPPPDPAPAPPRPRPTEPSERTEIKPTPGIVNMRKFRIVPTPKNASYSVDGGPWHDVSMGAADIDLGPGAHKIVFRHPACDDEVINIGPSDIGGNQGVRLPFKPTRARVVCPDASAILVNGRPADNGSVLDFIEFKDNGRQEVNVEFKIGDEIKVKRETVTAGAPTRDIKCDGA
jgi:hypothetical protein